MMLNMRSSRITPSARLLAAYAAVLAVLVTLRPLPAQLAHGLAHPQRWTADVGTDRAVITIVGAALCLLAAWVGVGLLAAMTGRLPGTAGTAARRVAVVALPRALYRVAAGAAGLGVLLSPALASAGVAHPGGTGASVVVPSPLPSTDSVPAPQLPLSATPANPASTHPASTHPTPTHPTPVHPTPADRTAASSTVTVRPGDSLWHIAASRLGGPPPPARIAAAWPRWFAANRAVIGPDPDYLVPGEVLHVPESF